MWTLDMIQGRIKLREAWWCLVVLTAQSVLEVARAGLRDGPCWKLKVPIVANSCYNVHCPVLQYSSTPVVVTANWQQVQSRTRQWPRRTSSRPGPRCPRCPRCLMFCPVFSTRRALSTPSCVGVRLYYKLQPQSCQLIRGHHKQYINLDLLIRIANVIWHGQTAFWVNKINNYNVEQ